MKKSVNAEERREELSGSCWLGCWASTYAYILYCIKLGWYKYWMPFLFQFMTCLQDALV